MKTLTALITSLIIFGVAVTIFAFDNSQDVTTGEAYYDIASGHSYFKNSDETYSEYTRKGELFRASVLNNAPRLTTHKYIREIGNNCYFLYEKWHHNTLKRQILPASSIHPKGWLLKAALACANASEAKEMGLGHSTNNKKLLATGDAYYDIASGHRYMKNPDTTYTEYTRKGDLFRASVPNEVPLLTTNKYIRELGKRNYLMYERKNSWQSEIMVISSKLKHPEGWRCKKMLIAMR